MLNEEVPDTSDAYCLEIVHEGWTTEIEKLIREFSRTQKEILEMEKLEKLLAAMEKEQK